MAGWHEATKLRHDDSDAGHTEDSGFTGCVGASKEVDIGGVAAELDIVGYEVCDVGEHARVAQVFEFDDSAGVIDEDGAAGGFA